MSFSFRVLSPLPFFFFGVFFFFFVFALLPFLFRDPMYRRATFYLFFFSQGVVMPESFFFFRVFFLSLQHDGLRLKYCLTRPAGPFSFPRSPCAFGGVGSSHSALILFPPCKKPSGLSCRLSLFWSILRAAMSAHYLVVRKFCGAAPAYDFFHASSCLRFRFFYPPPLTVIRVPTSPRLTPPPSILFPSGSLSMPFGPFPGNFLSDRA